MYSTDINLLVDSLSSGSEALVYGTLNDVCEYEWAGGFYWMKGIKNL